MATAELAAGFAIRAAGEDFEFRATDEGDAVLLDAVVCTDAVSTAIAGDSS